MYVIRRTSLVVALTTYRCPRRIIALAILPLFDRIVALLSYHAPLVVLSLL